MGDSLPDTQPPPLGQFVFSVSCLSFLRDFCIYASKYVPILSPTFDKNGRCLHLLHLIF